jgi:hypothetical protein
VIGGAVNAYTDPVLTLNSLLNRRIHDCVSRFSLRGKVWAFQDFELRASKPLKDRAASTRILEEFPEFREIVPPKSWRS